MTTYNYTKQPVDIDTLTTTITGSSISSAVYQAASFTAPDDLDIIFDTDLSAPDKTTLDGIVAAHTGTPVVAPENAILMADGTGRLKYDVVQATDVEGLETEVEAYSGAYPRRYIASDLRVNVKDWAQYVVHHGKIEVAGTLELGDGGMLIIRET